MRGFRSDEKAEYDSRIDASYKSVGNSHVEHGRFRSLGRAALAGDLIMLVNEPTPRWAA